MRNYYKFFSVLSLFFLSMLGLRAQYQMEKLNRGIIAVRAGSNNFISWRFLGTEEDATTFNLYRGGTKVNANPLTATNFTDIGAAATSQYYVKVVVNGAEEPQSETVGVWGQQYLNVPLQIPGGGTSPSGEVYTYSASDCSIGDVDGDGIYEIFVKWEPSNAKDNSQSGYTGNVYIDCYKLTGTRLWRIDLGRNIRAGAHYTQFMVFDFDGDGKAEMACKTADGTKDAANTFVGNSTADYRSTSGYILTGPEYLTMFNGATGKIMQTVGYIPARGTVSAWGDGYGNRVDRFLAGVAYLDGKKPSLISCRGYYTRTVVVAWDWVNGAFVRRWTFDSNVAGSQYAGQGDHSLSIADADNDGKQEIIYGAMVIDDNGTPLYSTGYGHGDALHVSDFDPSNPGVEIFNIQERDDDDDCYLYSALQKRVIWKKGATGGEGPGRGVGANVSDASPGAEFWVAGGQGLAGAPWSPTGASSGVAGPGSCNFLIYWDGDLTREISNGTNVDKVGTGRIFTASGTSSNNGSKSTPNLSGDILGDWREELILRASDNSALRIYTTVTPTTHKVRTLVHDAQYRVALAWQNTAYNQPPHPSFFLGSGVALPAKPNITIVGGGPNNVVPTASITSPATNSSIAGPTTITINANAADIDGMVAKVEFYNNKTTKIGEDLTAPYSFAWTNVGAGSYALSASAIDEDGAIGTSTEVSVTVTSTNAAPVVSITSPTNNTIINGTPATVLITAAASDANGSVAKVEFFEGPDKIGEDITSGYSFNWTNVAAGTYTLTAIATDNLGATTTSAPIVISVISLPFDCNNVSGGSAKLDACGRCTGGSTGKVACISVSEAEYACKFDGIREDINEGFSDSGYVNISNAVGSSITFAVMAQNAGNATISLRFANGGTTSRPGQLSVNGVFLPGTVSFDTTGAWNDWDVVDVPLSFVKGNNTLVVSATTAGGLPNIDQMGFVTAGLNSGICGTITGVDYDASTLSTKVFPNPSSKDFNIILPNKADVKVMNMQGATLDHATQVSDYQFGSNYNSGVYMVEVVSNGSTKIYRVIKK